MQCDLCDQPDSLHHRLWECEGTKAIRDAELTHDEQAWLAAAEGADSPESREDMRRRLARQGYCRNPGVGQPRAACEGSQYMGNTAELLLAERVAIDGHCSREFHPALNRASWSIIGLNFGPQDDKEKRQVSGPVWDGLPQTSASAERVAMVALHPITDQNAEHLEGKVVHVVVDRLGAMHMVTKQAKWADLRFSHYAGMQQDQRVTAAFRQGRVTASHVISHQESKLTPEQLQAQTPAAQKERAANEEADRACEEARAQHPGLDADMAHKDRRAYEIAGKVLLYAAKALDLFPPNENTRGERQRPSRRGTPPYGYNFARSRYRWQRP